MSDWKDHISPLQWLNAILRFLGKLVPKNDHYKTNLFFDALAFLAFFGVLYRVPSITTENIGWLIFMLSTVIVVAATCVLLSLVLNRPR